MRHIFRLAWVALAPACAAPAHGPAAPPLGQPGAPEYISLYGVAAAVDKESISVQGFDVELQGRGRAVTRTRGGWVAKEPHTAVFLDGGPLGMGGRTLAVSRSEMTREALTPPPAGGGEPITLHLADQPVRKFPARGPLAEGTFRKKAAGGETYGLADVAVGDWVIITGHRVAGIEYAETISIRRRPGGRVPPAPGDVAKPPPENQPWFHQAMNAEQDWEDHGIKPPKGWTIVPDDWEPVYTAPPPREVQPKPPGR